MKHTVSVIGSGNWGTAVSKLISSNIATRPDFNPELYMWTFEETIGDKNLTHIINTEHENVKYLPGVALPKNLKSVPDLRMCVENSDVLVFVVPHQFIKGIVSQIQSYNLKKECFAITLIKGILTENGQIVLISEYIKRELRVDCAVLMGANIASQVAMECVSEGTLACSNDRQKRIFMEMFNCYTYRVTCVEDIASVELSGTLKNIVCIGYGITGGLNYPSNTRAAVLRNGLKEIVRFCQMFFEGVQVETFFESAGIADLFVSALSGRNFRCGESIAKKKDIAEIEQEMQGQKLQGTLTSKEVYEFLKGKGKTEEFPLFTTVYKICYEDEPCDSILEPMTSDHDSFLEQEMSIKDTSQPDLTILEEKPIEDTVYLSNIYNLIHDINQRIFFLNVSQMQADSTRRNYAILYRILSKGKVKEAMDYLVKTGGDIASAGDLEKSEAIWESTRISSIKRATREFMARMGKLIWEIERDVEVLGSAKIDVLDELNVIFPKKEIISSVRDVLHKNKVLEEKIKSHRASIDTMAEVKELRENNIKLQNNVNKLTETSAKLKKEYLLACNELNGLRDMVRKKNGVIDKQGKIIDVLQKSFSKPENGFPIDDIKMKIDSLKMCIEQETGKEEKKKLIDEMVDLEKRLFDYLNLTRKNNK